MSVFDPLQALEGLDRPVEPRPEFADALLADCLAELEPRPRRKPLSGWSRLRVLVAAALVILALAAIATATYLAVKTPDAAPPGRAGQLTLIDEPGGRIAGPHPDLSRIAVVRPDGRLQTIWQCPHHTWCGDLQSIAWSPDGRRLAMTFNELGGRSGYVGLHVVDIATGVDHHLASLSIPHLEREQPTAVLRRLVARFIARLGCPVPHEVTWSPDSKQLAYVCGDDFVRGDVRTQIYLIRSDGTGRRRLRTGTPSAYMPTWSPGGERIGFATGPRPRISYRRGSTAPLRVLHSDVYTVRLDGSARRLVARDASAPVWSPDGKTIAFDSLCGIRLATPTGVDVTPTDSGACPHIAPPGLPAWSPDGARLAIATESGTDLVSADGTGLRHATDARGSGLLGGGRPAWASDTAVKLLLGRKLQSDLTDSERGQ